MKRSVGLFGVPTSAGAFAPGQEQAPQALRDAGLVAALRHEGAAVRDLGDRPVWRWRPDRSHPRAQNATTVAAIVRDTATRVSAAVGTGEFTLVLGGDCTVGVGTVAAHLTGAERVGLIYFDAHADLNVPDSVPEGALDWMGMAHMLGVPGAVPELVAAGPRTPLLSPDQVLLFGWGAEQATTFEQEAIARLSLRTVAVDAVAAAPEAAAARALELIDERSDRVLIHFDVDVIDFTDVPLSENTGRNQGLAYADALRALHRLLASPRVAGLTITELNPDHAESGAGTVARFAGDVARAVCGAGTG